MGGYLGSQIPSFVSDVTSASGDFTIGSDLTVNSDATVSGGIYLGGTGSANYLDDYEEGNWTPVIKFGGNSAGQSYSANVGKYIKVGDLVTVFGVVLFANKGTSTGNVTLTGLPFSATDWTNVTSIEGGTFVCSFSSGLSNLYNPLMFAVVGGNTVANAYSSTSDGGSLDDNVDNTKFSNSTGLRFSGSYYVGPV